jgi:tetratricopeptide (TPR) repeat protein
MQSTVTESPLVLIGKIAGGIICVGIIGAGLFWWYRKSDDRPLLLFKWFASIPGIIGFIYVTRYLQEKVDGGLDYGAAFFGAALSAVVGLYFAIVWRKNIAMIVARPFGALYDGGTEEAPPQAFYSGAEAKRKRGHYPEAIAEIRKELEKFPTDFTGQMLLAEIQAENLNDLSAAALIIQRICHQPKHAPRNIAYALNTLADWHLKYAQDPDAAREALQQVVTLLPDSELALLAEQRIGHLASRERLTAAHDRPRIPVPHGVQNIGLMQSSAHLAPAPVNQADRAAELVRHLEQHPQDTEAREQLAVIYADHYQRLDLAADQLSQLINQPNQPATRVIRWLNLLADLQVRHGCQYDSVAQTLAQIIERYPNHGAADLARNRLDLLRLELKAKTTPQSVKLGTYEQNIGLKQDSRGPHGSR